MLPTIAALLSLVMLVCVAVWFHAVLHDRKDQQSFGLLLIDDIGIELRTGEPREKADVLAREGVVGMPTERRTGSSTPIQEVRWTQDSLVLAKAGKTKIIPFSTAVQELRALVGEFERERTDEKAE